ncbi:MAG TPA: PAS domain S-box protein [Planctomycetota bacterium]
MEERNPKKQWTELRRAAESRLARMAGAGAPEGLQNAAELVHELQVHHAELEMQNEELRAAQIELGRSRDRYRRLYDLVPVGVVVTDPSGRVRESNSWAAKLLGVAHSELVGRPLQKYMPEASANVFHHHLRSVFAGSARHACELEFERRGAAHGRSIPVRVESLVFADDAGNRTLCQSVLMNLAEIREAQESLRTSEARTTTILHTAADAIVSSDVEGTIESFNRAAELLFGYAAAEVIGRNVRMLMPGQHSEQHAGYIRRYLSTGVSRILGKESREVEGLAKDGRQFPLDLTIGEWWDRGERKFAAVMHDASQRKAAADSLREERDFAERLFQTAPVIVLVLDGEGRVVRFNHCFERLTGYGIGEVRGADWFTTFLPEGDHVHAREVFAGALGGENTSGTVNAIRTKGGTNVEVEWHNTVLRDAQGRVSGVLAIGLDVTRRRQLEESQRLEAVGELAAGVAHEINNPLNTIVNCAQLVLDGDPARDNCQIIMEEGVRISGIVKDLLQFARDDRGTPQPTCLAEVVGRTVRLLGENLKRHGIRLQVEVPPELPPVLAHPQQLQQVLLNLLINAKDSLHAHARESRLVTVHARAEEGNMVSCRVRDNGPGIPPDLARRIFEPFVTTKRARGGTGLGLSVSKSIIERFGGRLTVESVPGEFAEFTFVLSQAPGP